MGPALRLAAGAPLLAEHVQLAAAGRRRHVLPTAWAPTRDLLGLLLHRTGCPWCGPGTPCLRLEAQALVPLGLALQVAVWLGVAEGDPDAMPLQLAVAVAEAERLAVGVALGVPEEAPLQVPDGVQVLVAEEVRTGLWLGLQVALAVAVADGLRLGDGLPLGVGLLDGEAAASHPVRQDERANHSPTWKCFQSTIKRGTAASRPNI